MLPLTLVAVSGLGFLRASDASAEETLN